MGGDGSALDREAAASLIGWWLEAGVDTPVAETPRDWLRPARPVPHPEAQETAAIPDPAPAARPDSLDAFHAWLKESSDLPLFQAGVARALPHGPANADIMLVSDLPTRECVADGQPIGGEAWQLTMRMLAAIGFKPEQAYVASLSCFPAAAKRISEGELQRCADAMRRQIELVAPKRLLLLGDGPSQALLGLPMGKARGRVHRVEGIPAVATIHPRNLLQRPSDKAHAWRDLLLLMSEEIS